MLLSRNQLPMRFV
ncbi:UNVERIFIED_CONTAM: hypothetical protein GTU68_004591 [Idotea baltica]|nr:hypothetical protein [Idotea baltica]